MNIIFKIDEYLKMKVSSAISVEEVFLQDVGNVHFIPASRRRTPRTTVLTTFTLVLLFFVLKVFTVTR